MEILSYSGSQGRRWSGRQLSRALRVKIGVVFRVLFAAPTMVSLIACYGGPTQPSPPTVSPIVAVSISPPSATMQATQSLEFTASLFAQSQVPSEPHRE